MLVQALVMEFYMSWTARSHELIWPLPGLLGTVARLLGIDAAVQGTNVALHSMRQIHRLGATWELMLDPATVGFLAGAVTLTLVRSQDDSTELRAALRRLLVVLGLVLLVWMPLRAGLLMAVYLHVVLRTPYEADLDAMPWFWSTWVHLGLLVGPALISVKCRLMRFGERPSHPSSPSPQRSSHRTDSNQRLSPLALGVCVVGVLLITVSLFWDPIGTRQSGRVLVEEYHPDRTRIWEPTDRPYDTQWYGQPSGYNYACIYDYCSRFFTMARCNQRLTADALRHCDVLILKVPTRPYSETELDCIEDFVTSGGGLLLIGEHTNVYRTSDYLNPVAARFGFTFRPDCLFGVDSVFDQTLRIPLVPHPILQRIETMDFATSCSIAPGWSAGRAVVRSTGLKNKLADYHADNYYPQPSDDATMRYGAFVQLWATRYGQGRVVAFADSTIFSNFCVFDPGKSELMIGMIEWLNHRSGWSNPGPVMMVTGLVLVCVGIFGGRWRNPRRHRRAATSPGWLRSQRWPRSPVVLVGAGLLGWALGILVVWTVNDLGMPRPPSRPFVAITLDRTLCDVPLSKNGFVDASGNGYGVFAQWIMRLGYFSSRHTGTRPLRGDLVLYLGPSRHPGGSDRRQIDAFLRAGGTVAVIDDPSNSSTSNELIEPYGMKIDRSTEISGVVEGPDGWPAVPVEQASNVVGGEPLLKIRSLAVASLIRVGDGTLVVVAVGSRFRDSKMGMSLDVVPDHELRQVFELEYALLRFLRLPRRQAAD